MMNRVYKTIWGGANALLNHSRRIGWIDLLLLVSFFGILYAVIGLAHRWTGQLRPTIEIDLSAAALPRYALYSLSRGLIAYVFSLIFTLVYGYWAAKDTVAEQSTDSAPRRSAEHPGSRIYARLVLALVALFPTKHRPGTGGDPDDLHRPGLEYDFQFLPLARSLPSDLRDMPPFTVSTGAAVPPLELPSTMGLVWNSMMSMAGRLVLPDDQRGVRLGRHDFRLPGIGAYMSVAVRAATPMPCSWR